MISRTYVAAAALASVVGAVGPRRTAAVTKPIPLALLAGEVIRGWRNRPGIDNVLLTAAVAFSAAGDRAMLLEEFTPPSPADGERRLTVGHPLTLKDSRLACGATLFAGAQLSYCALLWRRGVRPRAHTLLPRVAVLGESAAVIAAHRPRLLAVLLPYGNTLATMSALAADAPTNQPALRVGGLLFLASDLTILNRRHLIGDPGLRRLSEIWVLASYFAAQALLIDGLAD